MLQAEPLHPRAAGTVPSAAGGKVGFCDGAGSCNGVQHKLIIFFFQQREGKKLTFSGWFGQEWERAGARLRRPKKQRAHPGLLSHMSSKPSG